jgi:hypothetical protein
MTERSCSAARYRNWVEDRADREYADRETKMRRSSAGVREAILCSTTPATHTRSFVWCSQITRMAVWPGLWVEEHVRVHPRRGPHCAEGSEEAAQLALPQAACRASFRFTLQLPARRRRHHALQRVSLSRSFVRPDPWPAEFLALLSTGADRFVWPQRVYDNRAPVVHRANRADPAICTEAVQAHERPRRTVSAHRSLDTIPVPSDEG